MMDCNQIQFDKEESIPTVTKTIPGDRMKRNDMGWSAGHGPCGNIFTFHSSVLMMAFDTNSKIRQTSAKLSISQINLD